MLEEQCVHRHRFDTQQHAMRVIADWIQLYNHRRPHQALGMKTPCSSVWSSSVTCAETAGPFSTANLIKFSQSRIHVNTALFKSLKSAVWISLN
ncbi:integrase core domain-containing protein [Thioalkalivibrio sp. XN279]|uniref:integrase core domain-containing protein n=1 Tax=Thioalkalivibrio sp. XN279 TaxID=2714953 RepID=UPI00351B4742